MLGVSGGEREEEKKVDTFAARPVGVPCAGGCGGCGCACFCVAASPSSMATLKPGGEAAAGGWAGGVVDTVSADTSA